MKYTCLVVFLAAASQALAQSPSPRERVLALAAESDVEVLLDRPYASTDNPRQGADVFLPRRRDGGRPPRPRR